MRTIFLAFLVAAFFPRLVAAPKVGVFNPEIKADIFRGVTGRLVYENLKKAPGLDVRYFHDLSVDSLAEFDTIIFSCVHSVEKQPADWKDNIRTYAETGGGVILTHDSCGFAHALSPSLFPEVLVATGRSSAMPFSLTEDGRKTFTAIPAKFAYAGPYAIMEKGLKGTVLAVDAAGSPTVVAGESGFGRVMGIGALIAGWEGVEQPEIDFLAECVRWTSAKNPALENPDPALLKKTLREALSLRKRLERVERENREQTVKLYNQIQYLKRGGNVKVEAKP